LRIYAGGGAEAGSTTVEAYGGEGRKVGKNFSMIREKTFNEIYIARANGMR
jgi:hypothetical protein